MADDPLANTPAEVYARIRNDALEEAAKVADAMGETAPGASLEELALYDCACDIRALKRDP